MEQFVWLLGREVGLPKLIKYKSFIMASIYQVYVPEVTTSFISLGPFDLGASSGIIVQQNSDPHM